MNTSAYVNHVQDHRVDPLNVMQNCQPTPKAPIGSICSDGGLIILRLNNHHERTAGITSVPRQRNRSVNSLKSQDLLFLLLCFAVCT